MSINNKKRERRIKEAFSPWICGIGLFIITSILLLAGGGILAITSSMMTPSIGVFAQEENSTTIFSAQAGAAMMTTTNTSSPSSLIQLSPQPVLQERTTTTSMTPINQTHMSATYTGNGTLTLSNNNTATNTTINFTTKGTALISLATNSAQAKETLVTDHGETATATFYEIVKFNPSVAGEGKGLTIAVIHTNSTAGTLAPLNGTIVAGISNEHPNGENSVTLWKWESGIGENAALATPPSTR
jgi:hypothetical protein